MRSKRVAILSALLLLHKLLFSQVYFSQLPSSPLTINPVNTGRYDGDIRTGGDYRNEKDQTDFSTKATIFFDTRILASTLPENDRLAVGVSAVGERYPYFGVTNNYAQLSLAYHKSLDAEGSQQLSVGFQGGWGNQRLQMQGLVFESTIINSGFSGVYPGQSGVNINYADFSLGAGYKGRITGNDVVTAGAVMYHVNHPYKIVNNSVFSLPQQLGGQLGWEHAIDDRRRLRYELLVVGTTSTHTLNDLIAGSIYETQIDETSYRAGAGLLFRRNYLTGSVVAPCITMTYNEMSLELSYEVSVSNKETDQRGAFEVGVVYAGRRHAKQ